MIYLQLFLTFLKVGAFAFGGGYAMLSLIGDSVLAYGWMTEEELLNFAGVETVIPGPIAVNMATFVGSSQAGFLGSLCATLGLILPSLEYGGKFGILTTVVGIFVGALCLNLIDKLVPHLHKMAGVESESHDNGNLSKVLLFVMAIAIHNLPEGIAAGVSFGSDDISQAIMIAGGIALQNIPEGMVIIGPMIAAGVSPRKTFICAMATGLVEVIGTLLGYFAVSIASFILPFGLAFAGGTMLYVTSDEIIPETHAHGNERGATYALLVGFCVMLVSDVLLN